MAEQVQVFIAHDYCGWDERYGRYTHVPSGDTLVQRDAMGQANWDKAQLDYLAKYPGLTVYKCPGAYVPTGETYGTTDEICERLRKRLG